MFENGYYDKNEMRCLALIPRFGLLIIMIWDVSISFICLYLYVKELHNLKLLLSHKNDISNVKSINRHIIKGVILTAFAIISSFLFLFSFLITNAGIGVVVDDISNIIC